VAVDYAKPRETDWKYEHVTKLFEIYERNVVLFGLSDKTV